MPSISNPDTRKILVTGATGKQGGAVVRALLERPPPYEHEILVLTRNPSSPSAQALEQKPNVTLLQGDLDDVEAIFQKAGAVWGVFSVQLPGRSKDPAESKEVKQGVALIDASIQNGVTHFVQTSVDRHGAESDKNPTNVPHFITKHMIEEHLKAQAQNSKMTYTIVRPVAFMDMLMPNMIGKSFGTMWASMGDTKLQVVSTKDIGIFVAQCFTTPELDEYKNTAISLAGDELTQTEANEIFWQVLHRPMPLTFGFVGSLFKWMIPDLGLMFQWFQDVGYDADINNCRKYNSNMLNLATWLKEESKY